MSIYLAARLRREPSFAHLQGRFCMAAAGISDDVCQSEAAKIVARRWGVICRVCAEPCGKIWHQVPGLGDFDFVCFGCHHSYGRSKYDVIGWLTQILVRRKLPSKPWYYDPYPEPIEVPRPKRFKRDFNRTVRPLVTPVEADVLWWILNQRYPLFIEAQKLVLLGYFTQMRRCMQMLRGLVEKGLLKERSEGRLPFVFAVSGPAAALLWKEGFEPPPRKPKRNKRGQYG